MSDFLQMVRELIETRWNRRSTLFLVLLLIVLFFLSFFSAIDLAKINLVELLALALILLTVAVVWVYTNRFPKVGKGKIGFGVAIAAENSEQQEQLRRDFILEIQKLLEQSTLRYAFSFIEFPPRLTDKITSHAIAEEYRRKSGCHFMIWGDVRSRRFQGEHQQFLSMEGIVAHKPLPKEVGKSLSAEFKELFPRRIVISSEGDIFQFEITAAWINVVGKYIIGIAALLSGDLGYAIELFEAVYAQTREPDIQIPAVVKIRERVPSRLAEIYLAYGRTLYNQWSATKDSDPLAKMEPYLARLGRLVPQSPDANNMRAIWLFLTKRDVAAAKAEINKAHKGGHVLWRYNLAFLSAYEGNLTQAVKQYRLAFRGYVEEPKGLDEITDFISWLLEVEPEKYQFLFCLGLIDLFAKQDKSRALQEFEKFIELADSTCYPEEIALAESYMKEIRQGMK